MTVVNRPLIQPIVHDDQSRLMILSVLFIVCVFILIKTFKKFMA